ncbi:uncharacterized protein LOC141853068 [Brevipalpus obovatus]|uniref:uncharacterized protein LOC141853068 n=1 Tax=Brevipalpus obovatus TaxID=246614 RepID=UPI003D9FAE94
MSSVKDLNDKDWPALGVDSGSATTSPSKISKKKASKNQWRPLVIEPQSSDLDDRRHANRISRRKDIPSATMTNSTSETNGKKSDGSSSLSNRGSSFVNNNSNSPPEKSLVSSRGSRRGGRGRGRGAASSSGLSISNSTNSLSSTGASGGGSSSHRGGGSRSRGHDSGHVTPNQHGEDFLGDIQYYVDYSPLSEASLSSDIDVNSATLSPTAAFVAPGIVPPTTAFVPTYFPPYAPLLDPISLKKCIKAQIEYYFSEENLQRDFFLRRRMDEEGYLPISLIASFHRVKTLTASVDMVIEALQTSEQVEFNEDGSKLRTIQEPTKWPILDQRTQ